MAVGYVQSCYTRTIFVNHTVTFPAPLTAGNLILLFCNNLNKTILNTAAWTPVSTTDTDGFFLAYRYAQAGDGTTPPAFWLDTSNISAAEAVEISGVTGTFANDFEGYTRSSSTPVVGNPSVNANAIALCGSGQGSGFGSYTPGSGFTNLQASGIESMSLDYKVLGASGTTPTDAPSWGVGGTSGHWVMAIVSVPSGSPGEGDASIGTITVTAPGAEAQVPGEGDASIGTVTVAAPTVVAGISPNAAIGTITVSAPRARAHIDTGDGHARATQIVRITIGDGDGHTRSTQIVRQAIATVDAKPRATQIVRQTICTVHPGTRSTQITRQIIADAVPCVTRWQQLWRIQRTDGRVFCYTSLDQDFPWGDEIYRACKSLQASASESGTALGQIGSVELNGMIVDDAITEADLYGGLFDDAHVQVWSVPYTDTGECPRRLAAGWTGNLSHDDASFSLEVVGPGAKLAQTPLTTVVTPTCRWVFGDGLRCPVDRERRKRVGHIVKAASRSELNVVITTLSAGFAQWPNGSIRFRTGPNSGIEVEVKDVEFGELQSGGDFQSEDDASEGTGTGTVLGAKVTLWALPPFLPEPGDDFDLLPGCDLLASTCKGYGVYKSFGGFPDVPGQDSIMATPLAKV
jgi:uncharacterized phage protein (TIGR02218 family)